MKITAYADELLEDVRQLENWPQQVRTMQENWIGRSEGVELSFTLEESDEEIFVKFRKLSDILKIDRLTVASAVFGIRGKGYAGKHRRSFLGFVFHWIKKKI